MADMAKVFKALESINHLSRVERVSGFQAGGIVNTPSGFKMTTEYHPLDTRGLAPSAALTTSTTDNKAAAAYHPLDPRAFNPAATFTTGAPTQPAQERKRFLRISKGKDAAFFVKIPAASPSNLLGRVAQGQIGEWHVEEVIDEVPVRLGSFDHYDEAVAYVAHVLRTIGDEGADIEDEYASVGEVPC